MDLNTPLGMNPKPPRRRFWPVVGALVGLLVLGGLGAYLFQADPRGGEPYAVAVIPPPPHPAPPPANTTDTTPTGSTDIGKTPPGDSMRMENGVKVVSPLVPDRPALANSGPLVIDVSKALDADARKKTAAREGQPRPGIESQAATASRQPRIAIFVSGMGLDPAATRTATETLPAAVTLAFVPYGTSLKASIDAARSKGHEILLQLPMQGADGSNPGPHTLKPDESSPDLATDLTWLTGRVEGYVGVTNLLGAPVTADPQAMTGILKAVGQRGLFYLDDGTSKRSVARSMAAKLAVPAVQADIVLDATADPAMVQANLDRLAVIARSKGTAIGMASGLPEHLPAIARFLADLDGQGLTLVPVSAIVGDNARLATTR